MNLRKLADDIRRSINDEHFEDFLLKAEELFAEEIEKAKVLCILKSDFQMQKNWLNMISRQ